MGINISKLFVKSGAFNTLRIQSVAHALNNAYLHAHDSLVYCYSQHLSSSKERKIISKKQESSKAFYLNQRPLPQEFMHQRHHLLYPPCFSLEGCNRYRIIKCGYFQYAKQVYDEPIESVIVNNSMPICFKSISTFFAREQLKFFAHLKFQFCCHHASLCRNKLHNI